MSTHDILNLADSDPAGAQKRVRAGEIALFVDADGTLLDIAMKPDEVVAPPGLVATLEAAFDTLEGALAIVTGRRIEDIDRIFEPSKLPVSGVHGAQMRVSRDAPVLDGGAPDIPQPLANSVRKIAAQFPGVIVEDKREALAVHWRASPQFESALHVRIVELLRTSHAAGLTILRGHCVFEIKSSATSKGDAVRAFMRMAPFAGRTPVFIGDDVTDLAGMAAAKALGGRAFAVGAPLPGADHVFATPADVRDWLGVIVGRRGRGKE